MDWTDEHEEWLMDHAGQARDEVFSFGCDPIIERSMRAAVEYGYNQRIAALEARVAELGKRIEYAYSDGVWCGVNHDDDTPCGCLAKIKAALRGETTGGE